MSLTEKIRETIELLKDSDIRGCITGSSMIPDANFDEWDSVPDVDVFVYSEPELLHCISMLMYKEGFALKTKGEEFKFGKLRDRRKKKNFLSTIKLVKDGVTVNVTYKEEKTNIFSVLASFDQTVVMVGFDIPFQWGIDMRTKDVKIFDDRTGKWSDDSHASKPNPARKQEADMYTAEMWIRQWDRVVKYWNRGFDTTDMARFYIDLIDEVIGTGRLFDSEKSIENFDRFEEEYTLMRTKMVQWLEDKEEAVQ